MSSLIRPLRTTSALLLFAVAAAGSAWSADGFVTTRAKATKVHASMSADEVLSVLGSPQRKYNFRNMPGATWVYGLTDLDSYSDNYSTVVDVDFDETGHVATVTERVIHAHESNDKTRSDVIPIP
ncbi:outer membrane protein assembly factor BamE [Rhodoferax sp. GW822-FHT02A01]|uniref:outer membrane protein assembly factor BamE domain-containing protein n=1 Tax=Rhodoferax sp. GW822-FHT02A01 TaxID=3141537 RepID=UPI00315DB2C4